MDTKTPQYILEKEKNIQQDSLRIGTSGKNAMQGSMEPFTESEDKDTRLANTAKKADVNIPVSGNNDYAQINEFYKLSGETAEELTQANTPNSKNLNHALEKNNVPNVDITSPDAMISVKAMRLKDGEPRFGIYNHHFKNLVNPDSHKNELLAQELFDLQNNEPEKWKTLTSNLPNEVANAKDDDAMKKAFVSSNVMAISYNQVDAVKIDLTRRIYENPQDYGLHAGISESFAKNFADQRIRAFDPDISASDIDIASAASMNKRHGKNSLWA